MGRILLKVAGIGLAVWLAVTVVGAILSTLKTFFFIGLVAAVVMLVVTLLAKSGGRR
ncbi:MAG TPA: hypothetical protein VHJ17_18890 [Thermomonospora sp.]|nr:hypothetical protein [Thermomonospora sp.]